MNHKSRALCIAVPLILVTQLLMPSVAVADNKASSWSKLTVTSIDSALKAAAAATGKRAATPAKSSKGAVAGTSSVVTPQHGNVNKTLHQTVTASSRASITSVLKNGKKSPLPASRFASEPQGILPQDSPDNGDIPPADQAPVDPSYTSSELYSPLPGETADFNTCFGNSSDDYTWSVAFSHISACYAQGYQLLDCHDPECSNPEIGVYGSVNVGSAWRAADKYAPTDIIWDEYIWPIDPLVTVPEGSYVVGVSCGTAPTYAYTWSTCESISGPQTIAAADMNAATIDNPLHVTHRVRITTDPRDGETDQYLTHWTTQHYAHSSTVPGVNNLAGITLVRCDQSPYFTGAAGGCVFDVDVSSFNRLSIYNSDIDEMSWHVASSIWLIDGMPGGDVTNPLTRDKTNASAARTIARARCQSNFPEDFADPTKQCDEYPFASTAQNAYAYADFSVEEISASDNQIGGTYLAGWYYSQRIIKGDQFTIYVIVIG
jgi:Deoxyribonuclease NucA/NucB